MQILLESCIEKSMRDQLSEAVTEGNTVEGLLQENNLTLTRAITICHSKEAAKRHCFNIARESKVVAALRHPYQPIHQVSLTYPGCGVAVHKKGQHQCPACNQVCVYCHKKQAILQKYSGASRTSHNLVTYKTN